MAKRQYSLLKSNKRENVEQVSVIITKRDRNDGEDWCCHTCSVLASLLPFQNASISRKRKGHVDSIPLVQNCFNPFTNFKPQISLTEIHRTIVHRFDRTSSFHQYLAIFTLPTITFALYSIFRALNTHRIWASAILLGHSMLPKGFQSKISRLRRRRRPQPQWNINCTNPIKWLLS